MPAFQFSAPLLWKFNYFHRPSRAVENSYFHFKFNSNLNSNRSWSGRRKTPPYGKIRTYYNTKKLTFRSSYCYIIQRRLFQNGSNNRSSVESTRNIYVYEIPVAKTTPKTSNVKSVTYKTTWQQPLWCLSTRQSPTSCGLLEKNQKKKSLNYRARWQPCARRVISSTRCLRASIHYKIWTVYKKKNRKK